MGAHRRVAMPFRGEWGKCGWCGQETVDHPKGTRSKRRSWHDGRHGERNCIGEYKIANSSEQQRWACEKRDGGKCAGCGETVAIWEADHVRPLWSVKHDDPDRLKYFGIDNLQTLCVPCHRAKSAREAAERAKQRTAA